MVKFYPLIYLYCFCFLLCCSNWGNNFNKEDFDGPVKLEVTALGRDYNPDENEIAVYQNKYDPGGSTSVRNVDMENLEWKPQGYFQRNRDLGQVFIPEKDFWLRAIVLRTGPSDKAVLSDTPGSEVFLQFYEVEGKPVINDNKTPTGTDSKHGFSKNHRTDDFIEGVKYRSINIIKGGIFPDIPPTFEEGKPTNNEEGRLHYMRWQLHGTPLKFVAGKSYAFMVGFEEPQKGLGFTLANYNAANEVNPPAMKDAHDVYLHGWGLRREGDGTLPPTMISEQNPPKDEDKLNLLYQQSLFSSGEGRYQLEPTTDGYPDVDTYRDLEFALEVFWEKP